MSGFLGLFIGIAILIYAVSIFSRSKSNRIRELSTNLYVIGMIRKIAKEDGIDLQEEYRQMLKLHKRFRIENHELDHTVEENIQEKINDRFDKPKAKDTKKAE